MSKESLAFDGRDWDTLGERGNLLAGEGWRYTGPRGRVRHKIDPNSEMSLCGLANTPPWYGTGSQSEYEKLASLPKCSICMRSVE